MSWATSLLITCVHTQSVVSRVRCPGPLGTCTPVCPLRLLCCLCSVLGQLALVHRCARSVCFVWRSVRTATWLLFTGVPARCVVLRVRCPGPLGSCSPVWRLDAWLCLCVVLGPLDPGHGCARSVCCVVCAVSCATWLLFNVCARLVCCVASAVSSATWLLFTGAPALCVVLHVPCPGLLGSCSAVCALGPSLCLCGVLGHLAPVHRCARLICCVVSAVS